MAKISSIKAVYSQEGPQEPGAHELQGVKGTYLLRLLLFFFFFSFIFIGV